MEGTREPSFNDNTPVLHQGDAGEAVLQLQQLLNRQGARLNVDGQFGGTTLAAVISFQQRQALPVHGQVDQTTWGALAQKAGTPDA